MVLRDKQLLWNKEYYFGSTLFVQKSGNETQEYHGLQIYEKNFSKVVNQIITITATNGAARKIKVSFS